MIPPSADGPTDEIVLGHISGVFGFHGELRLFLYNPGTELLDEPRKLALVLPDGARRTVSLRVRPGAGKRILGTIAGVDTEADARALVGAELRMPRAALPPAGPGAWYHVDLIGLPVRTASGRELGHIADISSAGGTDVWILQGPLGERYIPVLRALIDQVELGVGITVADEADVEPG